MKQSNDTTACVTSFIGAATENIRLTYGGQSISKLEKMISIYKWFIMTLVKTLYISSFSAPSMINLTITTKATTKTIKVAPVK